MGERATTSELARTALHDWHSKSGARLVDFAGWSMPVQYTSIVEEHVATRTGVGLFDVSHMGRIRFDGPGAVPLLERLLTRRVSDMPLGKIRYSLVTNEQGGILDDVLVYRLQDADGSDHRMLVVNASNRDKILSWIETHRERADDVELHDQTLETAMIAVQGPKAIELVQPLVSVPVTPMKYYTGAVAKIGSTRGLVSRTGYSGEDGCELIVPTDAAVEIWKTLLERGKSLGARAAGLGARDTLRLEAALPLYGHELSETIDPFQADLAFAVNLEGREFIGSKALEQRRIAAPQWRQVGIELTGRRVPREHFAVRTERGTVGEVTSGTFSPTLQKSIALAYVRPDVADIGTDVGIEVRGQIEPGRIVKLPFYSRKKES
jgi:aminomethyltransferase